MSDESKLIMDDASDKMHRTLEHLKEALLGIRAGKANQHVLKGITVEYYGNPPLLSRWQASPSPMPRLSSYSPGSAI